VAGSNDVADVKTANGGVNVFVVGNLNPGTEYCFKVAAVRGEQNSQLSETACATTAVAAQVTASPTVAASAGPESTASSPSESAAAGATASSPAGDQQGGPDAIVPPPAGGSDLSQGGTAASTAPSSSPGSATASSAGAAAPPVFTANQYIDIIATIPAADAQAGDRAEGRRQQFKAAGVTASILRTTDLPGLKIAGNVPVDSYLIYLGPFGSAQEAQARCTAQPPVGALCETIRPNPGGN
jgi:hypothetical protein